MFAPWGALGTCTYDEVSRIFLGCNEAKLAFYRSDPPYAYELSVPPWALSRFHVIKK